MTYYKTSSYHTVIEQVEAERVSDNFIMIDGRRTAIRSSYDNYFLTREEAKQFYIDKELRNIEGLEDRLAYAKDRLKEAESL